jgi:hypothetical protein
MCCSITLVLLKDLALPMKQNRRSKEEDGQSRQRPG